MRQGREYEREMLKRAKQMISDLGTNPKLFRADCTKIKNLLILQDQGEQNTDAEVQRCLNTVRKRAQKESPIQNVHGPEPLSESQPAQSSPENLTLVGQKRKRLVKDSKILQEALPQP